jgi:hypothetical protein
MIVWRILNASCPVEPASPTSRQIDDQINSHQTPRKARRVILANLQEPACEANRPFSFPIESECGSPFVACRLSFSERYSNHLSGAQLLIHCWTSPIGSA